MGRCNAPVTCTCGHTSRNGACLGKTHECDATLALRAAIPTHVADDAAALPYMIEGYRRMRDDCDRWRDLCRELLGVVEGSALGSVPSIERVFAKVRAALAEEKGGGDGA